MGNRERTEDTIHGAVEKRSYPREKPKLKNLPEMIALICNPGRGSCTGRCQAQGWCGTKRFKSWTPLETHEIRKEVMLFGIQGSTADLSQA